MFHVLMLVVLWAIEKHKQKVKWLEMLLLTSSERSYESALLNMFHLEIIFSPPKSVWL